MGQLQTADRPAKELDFSSILFRMIDRLGLLSVQITPLHGDDFPGIENYMSGMDYLEGMVLPFMDQSYYDEKKSLLDSTKNKPRMEIAKSKFRLLMMHIVKKQLIKSEIETAAKDFELDEDE